MARIWSRWETVLFISLTVAAGQAACGMKPGGSDLGDGSGGGSETDGGNTGGSGGQGGIDIDPGEDPENPNAELDIQPAALQTITVSAGQTSPTVSYQATLHGKPVNAAWSVDRGDVGKVDGAPASEVSFEPTGKVGGLVNVSAHLNGKTVNRQVLVKLEATQNGADPTNPAVASQIATDIADLKNGGGIGGVGGEGLGPSVADSGLIYELKNPQSDGQAEELEFLYPYDGTVWPRGLLAPLLMWRSVHDDADAIFIELETKTRSFHWQGTFARPEILQTTGGKFIRHPIPQDVWEMATNSAGGATADNSADTLTVRLTVAKDNKAYGPISQTWAIAPARLSGIIYYNSYGTQLAKNHGGALGGDKRFGGAVLSIRVGDTGPKLVAGSTSADTSGCRVCHSVAPSGSRLIVQGPDNGTSNAYDLDPHGSNTAHVMTRNAEFAGIYPDGSMALTGNGRLLPLPDDSTELPISGLADIVTSFGPATFSPDGKRVALNPVSSPSVDNPKQKLLALDFDATTGTFSNPVTIADYSGEPTETRPGWPAFFPDGNSVVFHRQSSHGLESTANSGGLRTRRGAKAQIHWTSVTDASQVTPLDWLNGLDSNGNSYLPKLKQPIVMSCTADSDSVGGIHADHGDDVNLNYEPTISPIASGGYAWVVFTSRRMYGSVATIPPFCSDPRGVDLIEHVTTKKLWVAAIDLSAAPGKDASHPAFYLPGQELLAGNSQGFWVLDPCKGDGEGCESGDQCCGGFCRPNGEGGSLVCSEAPPDATCSAVQEKCESPADCCDPSNLCINGFCAQQGPK